MRVLTRAGAVAVLAALLLAVAPVILGSVVQVGSLAFASFPAAAAANEAGVLYDSTSKVPRFSNGTSWLPMAAGGSATSLASISDFTSSTGVAVGEVVYISAANTVVEADATTIATGPAVGIVIAKPTTTTATVQYGGEVAGLSGLTAGATYFVSTSAGVLTSTAPTATSSYQQKVGVARNSTTLVLHPSLTLVVN